MLKHILLIPFWVISSSLFAMAPERVGDSAPDVVFQSAANYPDGGTLDKLLGTPAFSQTVTQQPRFVFDLVVSVLNALRVVHKEGFERNFRLSDILLVERDRPVCKLCHILRKEQQGTDFSADVLKFGFLLYQLLHNQPNIALTSREIALGARPAISPQIPERWADFIKECWAHNPRDRRTVESLWQEFSKYDKAADPFWWLLSFYDTQIIVKVADSHSGRMFSFPKVPQTFTTAELKNNIARQNFRRPEVMSLYSQHQPNIELMNDARLPEPVNDSLNLVLMTSYCRVRIDSSFPLPLALTNIPVDNTVLNIPWSKTLPVSELKQEIAKLCEFKAGMGCCFFLNGVELQDDAFLQIGYLPSNSLPFYDCIITLGDIPLKEFCLRYKNLTASLSTGYGPLFLSMLQDSCSIVSEVQEQTYSLITGTPYTYRSVRTITDRALNVFLASSERGPIYELIQLFCQCLVQMLQLGEEHHGDGAYIFSWCAEKKCERFAVLLMGLDPINGDGKLSKEEVLKLLMSPDPINEVLKLLMGLDPINGDGKLSKEEVLKLRATHIWNATWSFKAFAIGEKYQSMLNELTKLEKELSKLKHTRLCFSRALRGEYAEKYDSDEAFVADWCNNNDNTDEATRVRYDVLDCSYKIEEAKLERTRLRGKLWDIDKMRFHRAKIQSLETKIAALTSRYNRQYENLQSQGVVIGSSHPAAKENHALHCRLEEKKARLKAAQDELNRLETREQTEMNRRKVEFISKNSQVKK